MEKKQMVMESYYTRGRDSSCNCIYLSQSSFQLPRHSIRNNANTSVLFKLNVREMQNFWRDNCSTACNKSEFEEFLKQTKGKYKYLFVKEDKMLFDIFQ